LKVCENAALFEGRGSVALYQGLTLVGPQRAERKLGFTGCEKTHALYQGTTSVVP
jgi:hypothetical protein